MEAIGHTLRMDENSPSHKSMLHCYSPISAKRFSGWSRCNMPWKLNQDLTELSRGDLQLKSLADLQRLKDIAHDRDGWKNLTALEFSEEGWQQSLTLKYGQASRETVYVFC